MIFASAVWSNSKEFAQNYTPLLDIATIYRYKKNIHQAWHILVLEGYEYYKEFEDELKSLNCYISDVSKIFHELYNKYRNIHDICYNNNGHGFHINNTLRWLIAAEYFGREDFLHTDIDLIINNDPQDIVNDISLYMGSTCFVNIKNTTEFEYLYSNTIRDYVDNHTYFIEQAKKLLEDERDINPWGIFTDSFYTEEALFYIFLKRHGLNWSDTRDQYIYIPFMAGMFGDIHTSFDRMSCMKTKHNQYKYSEHKHYINNYSMAYMHYQYNFRMILAFYLLQKQLNIPEDMLYCPNIHTRILRNKNMDTSCRDMAKYQHHWRQKKYANNFAADFLLGKLLISLEHTNVTIDGFKPEIYHNILKLEHSDLGLTEVLNNNFWYSKEVFV